MKKSICALLCLMFIFLSITGCIERKSNNETQISHSISKDVFLSNFEALLNPAGFSMITCAELEDKNAYSVSDGIYTYHISISFIESGEITDVLLSGYIHGNSKLSFAVLSIYIYDALEFPKIEAQEYYDKYNLFADKDVSIFDDIANGWELCVLDIDTPDGILRTFSIEMKEITKES